MSKFQNFSQKVVSSSGLTDENCVVTCCSVKNENFKQAPVTDGGIIVEVIKVPLQKIPKKIKMWNEKGYALSAQTLGALWLFKNAVS